MVDSDSAGDKVFRRSTVGQVAFVSERVVKHVCNILQVIGLSSCENEYYASAVVHDWASRVCWMTGMGRAK
eukprot:5906656-Pyramimonas_sp.AAC.1